MTTATSHMPHAQWALLNLIWRHRTASETGATRHAATVLIAAADASNDDLFALEDAELVAAVVDGVPVPAKIALTTFGFKDKTRLKLTQSGKNWVRANPRNKVLTYLAQCDRQRAPLRKTMAQAEVDTDAFFMLEDAGLLKVTLGRGGPIMSDLRHALNVLAPKSGDDRGLVWAQLTAFGRRITGVS